MQPIIDKETSKLVPWYGKNIATAGRGTLVKVVITSQAIFDLMSLCFPRHLANFQQA
jgi:hypothetical protein